MKKAVLTFILVLAVIVCSSLTLVACNDKEEEIKVQTITISNAEELVGLKDCLGVSYSKTTFELACDIDLAGAQWAPLGTDAQNAFYSVFDGKGHSITNVGIVTDKLSDDIETSTELGFFGFTHNATIKNLTLGVSYSYLCDSEVECVGGLIGFAYGNTVIDKVTVNGTIAGAIVNTALVNSMDKADFDEFISDYQFKLYLGGIIGSSTGVLNITDSNSNVSLSVGRYEKETLGDLSEAARLHTAYVGGVAGYVRTINLSASNTDCNLINNVVSNASISVYASRLNAGGAFGSVYNAQMNGVNVGGASLYFDAAYRANAGGVVGYIDNTKLVGGNCTTKFLEFMNGTTDNSGNIYNIGGLVGYAANNSCISESETDVNMVMYQYTSYAGGLAGVLCDSELKSSTARGAYYTNVQGRYYNTDGKEVTKEADGFVIKANSNKTNVANHYWAGAVSKLFGAAKLSDVDLDFNAYYAVLCIRIDRKKATGEKDVNGDEIFQDYKSSVDFADINYVASKVINTATEGNPVASID